MMLALTNAAIYVSIVSVLLLSLRVIRPGILPAQLGIGGKGQLTKFNKRRLQQNRTQHTINDICNKEPDHRLDPRVTVDQEHNLLFKHVHGKQQLAQTDCETYYEYYHRHKRRKRKLLQLVVLAVTLMTGRYVLLETVSNDLCSYVSQTGDLRNGTSDSISSALFSNTTEAPCLYNQRSNRSQPSTTHAAWLGEQLSPQQSPPSSLVTVSPALFGHPFCCSTMLLSTIDSLLLQQVQPCLAHRRTQSWPTRDSFRTLASITDTMTTADFLSEGVLQTSSFMRRKDSSNVSAPTTPKQKPVLQHDKGREAPQPHCPEQSATELKSPKGKHPFYAHLRSIINVYTFLTSIRIAAAQVINDAQCIAHLLCMLICNMTPLIASSIWVFLIGLGVLAAMHTEMPRSRSMHAGFHVHSTPVLSAYTIFLSLSGMAMRLALHAVTDFQCALTMVILYTFTTKTHWISACLLIVYALACFEQMLQGLEAALKHAILALIQKPKRYVFAHPKTIYGSYWRRIRNRTRRMRRQMLYMYLENLCKLLSHVQRIRLHECCTDSAYYSFRETQNGNNYAWDEDAQHTTSMCTRANHDERKGDKPRHSHGSSTPHQRLVRDALRKRTAWQSIETMDKHPAQFGLGQTHALNEVQHDRKLCSWHKPAEPIDMSYEQPLLSTYDMDSPAVQIDKPGRVLFQVKGKCMHFLINDSKMLQTRHTADKSSHDPVTYAGLSCTAEKYVHVGDVMKYIGEIPVDTTQMMEDRLNKAREADSCYEPDIRKHHPGADDTPISHQLAFGLGALCRNQNINVTGSVRDASVQKQGPYTWDNRFKVERIRQDTVLGINCPDSCSAVVKDVYSNVMEGCTITCGRPSVSNQKVAGKDVEHYAVTISVPLEHRQTFGNLCTQIYVPKLPTTNFKGVALSGSPLIRALNPLPEGTGPQAERTLTVNATMTVYNTALQGETNRLDPARKCAYLLTRFVKRAALLSKDPDQALGSPSLRMWEFHRIGRVKNSGKLTIMFVAPDAIKVLQAAGQVALEEEGFFKITLGSQEPNLEFLASSLITGNPVKCVKDKCTVLLDNIKKCCTQIAWHMHHMPSYTVATIQAHSPLPRLQRTKLFYKRSSSRQQQEAQGA